MANCKLTVIAPCRNEKPYIRAFLDNMLAQDYPRTALEILIIDGDSDDGTPAVVTRYARYPFIRLLPNPRRTVPHALNLGIRQAAGQYIVRADMHARYPAGYLTELIRQLEQLQADNVGGICRTQPAADTPRCRAIAAAMSSPFGVGNSYFRIGAGHIRRVDTVPFGCFRRTLFDRIGHFDEELTRNQDDEFNARILRNGGSIYLLPHLNIDYYARDTISKTARMFYQYGLFKPLVNRKLGAPATLRQFVPLAFLTGLLLGAVASVLCPPLSVVYGTVLLLYLALALWFARRQIRREPVQLLWMPVLFATLHLSYGWGYLGGIIRFWIAKQHTTHVHINR